MDIGVVTTSFPRNDEDWAGRFVLDQAKALTARGHNVTVVAPDDPGLAQRETIEGIEVGRVRYFAPRSLQRLAYGAGMPENVKKHPWTLAQLPFLLRALRRGVADLEPDVVLAHWALSGLAAGPLAERDRIGLATTLNGSDLRLALTNQRWQRMLKKALAGSDRVLVLGSVMGEQVIEEGFAPAGRVEVAPFGIEDELIEREVGPGEEGRVVFVGRLVASKGLPDLAEAVGMLAGRAHLVCVGAGPLAEEMNALGHVTCTGPLSRAELLDEVGRAAVVALPSYGEGLPITLLEAMSLGRPVIGTPVGAVPELFAVAEDDLGAPDEIDDRRCGVLVPIGDAQALAEALGALLADESLRAELGARARERIRKGYTWSRSAARLETVLMRTMQAADSR